VDRHQVGPRRKRKRLLEKTTEVDEGVGSRSAPSGADPERIAGDTSA
jgi:hypothetical protein